MLPLALTAHHTSSQALVHRNPPALNMLCQVYPLHTRADCPIFRPIGSKFLLCRLSSRFFSGSPFSPVFLIPAAVCGSGVAGLIPWREWAPRMARRSPGSKPAVRNYMFVIQEEQPLPSLLFVVKSHKRFTRYKGSGAVPYQRSPYEKATRTLHTVT